MSELRYPDSEVATVYWLRRETGASVSTALPETLPADGFVQVTTITGTPDIYTGVRNPTMQVDCWAGNNNKSGKVPWAMASALAEKTLALVNLADSHAPVELPGFKPFIVHQAYVVSEPRRIEDSRGYARYSFDIELFWSTVN